MTTAMEESMAQMSLNTGDTRTEGERGEGSGERSIAQRINELSREVSRLLESVYELEEIRHGPDSTERVEALFQSIDSRAETLPTRWDAIKADTIHGSSSLVSTELEALEENIQRVLEQRASIHAEIQDDAWMSRFNGTAEQANAMIEPMENSLLACTQYVESVLSSPVPVPFQTNLPELPSISALQDMIKRHESMRRVYTPSINKILRMMERSISDRKTANGAMLRRYDEMSRRWQALQKRLQQLDTRVRVILDNQDDLVGGAQLELLSSPRATDGYSTPAKPALSHRSSVSSDGKPPVGLGVSTFSPPSTYGKSSFMSPVSDIQPRIPSHSSTIHTPAGRRVSSVSRPGMPSPTPSTASSISRIPVPSSIPRLSANGRWAEEEIPQSSSRPRMSGAHSAMSAPRASLTPSLARSTTGPAKPRAPPSSYRNLTPAASPRPSSRLSMGSHAPSAFAPPNLQPFQPSPYDLLDIQVQSIINDVGFDLFVARVDQPLRKGQRRRDDEEWKGDYVFGAGQKTSGVKLLRLAGKHGEVPKMKCLARVQGAWQDLRTVLERRKDEAQ